MTPLDSALEFLAGEMRPMFEQQLRASGIGPARWHLPAPRICVMEAQRSKSKLGWYSPHRWSQGAAKLDELVLTPQAVSQGVLVAIEVLTHEFSHLANAVAHRTDTSREGRYHNELFRETATVLGLNVSQDQHHGWCHTTLGPELKQWGQMLIREKLVSPHVFKYRRQTGTPQKRSLVKLVCQCEPFVYVTRSRVGQLIIHCGVCGSILKPEEE